MKQFILLFLFFMAFFIKLNAQDLSCKVEINSIRGIYTGDCHDGKANGRGKSVGIDEYEGDFVNGYPEGKGTYIWKDGHYFIGIYKKGKKEGRGDMYYEAASGEDSVISGYWKKDKYVGEYEKQYIVIASSGRITKVECRLIDKKGDGIMMTVHQMANSGNLTSAGYIPSIGSISTINGTFYTKNNQVLTNSSITKIQGVTFPFRAIFNLTNGESTEILFNENGSYDVYIDM